MRFAIVSVLFLGCADSFSTTSDGAVSNPDAEAEDARSLGELCEELQLAYCRDVEGPCFDISVEDCIADNDWPLRGACEEADLGVEITETDAIGECLDAIQDIACFERLAPGHFDGCLALLQE